MSRRSEKIFMSIFAIVISILAALTGFWLLSSAEFLFIQRFLAGGIFMMTPSIVILLVITMCKKN